MNRPGHDNTRFFLGTEVEHTPALGMKTLFVIGVQPVQDIDAMLNDAWRGTSQGSTAPGDCGTGQCHMSDVASCTSWSPSDGHNHAYQATGVGGDRWYRFNGASGDALPLSMEGRNHCGTIWPGWLTGWSDV